MTNPIIFCNIAWMERYMGISQADTPRGGGKWVNETQHAHEACNFLICDDGNVYGHFETSKGEIDREVRLERLGASESDQALGNVDVVWTAPLNGNGARHVVGWYRNATIFRHRQTFEHSPSGQHSVDKIDTYRVVARAQDATLLPLSKRSLELGRGPGWSGQASWWYIEDSKNIEIPPFLENLRALMDDLCPTPSQKNPGNNSAGGNSAPHNPYTRYIKAYELTINPQHRQLQNAFSSFVGSMNFNSIRHDLNFVDLRYVDPKNGAVLCEVKPCSQENARYAIRSAIGQLLDYRQRESWAGKLLIVLGCEPPSIQDKQLATENGFGIAWPTSETEFFVEWP